MALSSSQLRLMQSPYRYPEEDHVALMEILSNRDEWDSLGSEMANLIVRFHSNAVRRGYNIPDQFDKLARQMVDSENWFIHPGRSR